MVLHTAMVGGWVTNMWAKIIRAVGDVGVPHFWLDSTTQRLPWGEGGLPSKRQPFFGSNVTWHTHIWDVTSGGPGRSNFDVDANPKISISIPAAGRKTWRGAREINDFVVNCTIFRKIFSAPAAGWGEGGCLLDRGVS